MNRHTAGQFAQSVGQTKTARWMRWQTNRFTSANQQMLAMADKGVLGGLPVSRLMPGFDDLLIVCATECNSDEDMDDFVSALKGALSC